jgi:hypothetical protein
MCHPALAGAQGIRSESDFFLLNYAYISIKVAAMHKTYFLLKNEAGSVMVAAIMILVLLTIVGIAAMNTSTTESHLATNTLLYERAFYSAEAGLEHVKAILKVELDKNINNPNPGRFDFALDGTGPVSDKATDCNFDGGVTLLDELLEGVKYTVTVWNNYDGVSGACQPEVDNDGRLMIRAQATGPRGAVSRIETLVVGKITGKSSVGDAIVGVTPGKGNKGNDKYDMDLSDVELITIKPPASP